MNLRLILVILVVQFNLQIQGAKNYFSSLSIEDGLPSNATNSIIQDAQGFIWIGTDEGLCRYDGYTMTYFNNSNNGNNLPSNRISALLLDEDIIWVGTWDKLCTINTQTFEVKVVNEGQIKTIRALYKDTNDNIWIGTNNGLFTYNKKNSSFRYFDSINSNLSHNTIRSFFQDTEGNMWIGTYDKLNKFDGIKFETIDLKRNYKPEISNNLILAIEPDGKSDSLLWIGTETGLCLFDRYHQTYKSYNSANTELSNEVIKSIHVTSDKLWLGTDYGLNIFAYASNDVQTFFHNPHINHSICNNVIWRIFNDSNDLLWFITSNGISRLEQSGNSYSLNEVTFEVDGIKAGNLIRDLLIENDGTKWLATTHGVISENVDGQRELFTSKSELSKRILIDNVYALEADKFGQIWIGTAAGINIWNKNKERMHAITSNKTNGLTSNYIKSFIKTPSGKMWIIAWEGGIYQVDGTLDNLNNIIFTQISNDGESLACTANNKLFYTSNQTLFEYDPISKQHRIIINNFDTVFGSQILNLIPESDQNILIVNKNGFLRYWINTDRIEYTNFKVPLPKTISIESDSKGFIWAATNNAIHKLTTSGSRLLRIPLNTEAPIKSLQSQSSCHDINGNIYFGGQNGYITIDPDHDLTMEKIVKTNISQLLINNKLILPRNNQFISKDIAYCNNFILPHNYNSLTFQFSNFDYWLPESNSYRYRLIGYDSQWHHPKGNKSFAIYSNLKPQDYTFEVIGTNHKGIVSNNTARVHFKIKPPIWLSTGFILLYLVIILLLLYSLIYIFNYRNKLTNKLNITKLEKEHSEQLLYNKQQFFTYISHEIRTPLSLISPPIKQVLQSGTIDDNSKAMLQLANKNSNRLTQLVNQILDFRKLETTELKITCSKTDINQLAYEVFESFSDLANRNEIDYNFTSSKSHQILSIDEEKIKTILFNLLSNAFKYTPVNGKIKLQIEAKDQQVILSVTDSGKGIVSEEQEKIFEYFYRSKNNTSDIAGTGIGLTLSMEYAKLHKGTILVNSEINKGSCFSLILPYTDSLSKDKENIDEVHFTKENQALDTKNRKPGLAPQNAPAILIIDDNPDILDFIELNLSMKYKIIRANSGEEGWRLAIKSHPSIIISDVMMPGMDGNALSRKIKSNAATMHIPIILLTAKTLDDHKLEGMKSGADMYITKPFSIEYLTACINNILNRENQLINYAKKITALSPNNDSLESNNQDTIFVKRVMTIIETNITNTSFSVESLAEEMNMSSTHLYRKLKTITTYSTQDIIKNYRLEKAAGMLVNKEGNITEIMYSVGFSSLSTFSKAFKSQYGKSPSEYIKTTQKKKTND